MIPTILERVAIEAAGPAERDHAARDHVRAARGRPRARDREAPGAGRYARPSQPEAALGFPARGTARADSPGQADGRDHRRHRRARVRARGALGDRGCADRDRVARRRSGGRGGGEGDRAGGWRRRRPAIRTRRRRDGRAPCCSRCRSGPRPRTSTTFAMRSSRRPTLVDATRAARRRDRRTGDPVDRRVAGLGRPAGGRDGAPRGDDRLGLPHASAPRRWRIPPGSSMRTS